MPPRITRVRLTPSRGPERGSGLLGWVSFELDGGLLIDGVALRRSQDGRQVFSWPARKDAAGRLHHHVRPLSDEAREAIETALLEQLAPWLRGGAA